MKELGGGGNGSATAPPLAKVRDLFDEQFVITDEHTGETLPHYKYRIENDAGEVLAQGYTDTSGKTARVTSSKGQKLRVVPDHN
jgi:type VI secretion system secreted protein VgrG